MVVTYKAHNLLIHNNSLLFQCPQPLNYHTYNPLVEITKMDHMKCTQVADTSIVHDTSTQVYFVT